MRMQQTQIDYNSEQLALLQEQMSQMQKMTAELNNRITRRGILEGQIKSNAQIQSFLDRQKSVLIENLAVDSEE